MEECYFCGQKYHPMPLWEMDTDVFAERQRREEAGEPWRIHVCNIRYEIVQNEDGTQDFKFEVHEQCENKARAAGYRQRLDLTPKR